MNLIVSGKLIVRGIATPLLRGPSAVFSLCGAVRFHTAARTSPFAGADLNAGRRNGRFFATDEGAAAKRGRKKAKEEAKPDDDKSFRLSSSEEQRRSDIQDMTMQAHSLLPRPSLKTLALLIQAQQAKMAAPDYESNKARYDAMFISGVKKFLEKQDAIELLDALVRCDLSLLRISDLKSSVLDIDASLELRHKVIKMNQHVGHSLPKSHYLFDDLKTNRPSTSNASEHEQRVLFDIASRHDILRSPEPSVKREAEEEGAIVFKMASGEELNVRKTTDLEQTSEVINDLDEADVFREPPSRSLQTINRTRPREPRESRVEKPKSSSKDIKPSLSVDVQTLLDFVLLKQSGHEERRINKTNWVYMSDLPYDFENEAELKQRIGKSFESVVGPIKDAVFFKYKRFWTLRQKIDEQIAAPENLSSLVSLSHDDFVARSSGLLPAPKPKNEIVVAAPSELVPAIAEDFKKKVRRTDALLHRIRETRARMLNRSYALVLLNSEEEKKKALSPHLRLLGVRVGENTCHVDDADFKLTLIVNNIPWGVTVGEFAGFLNALFERNHALDLRVDVPAELATRSLTRYFAFVRFNSFFDTLRAFRIIETAEFLKRPLRVQHYYGNLRVGHNGEPLESLDLLFEGDLKERVDADRLQVLLSIYEKTRAEDEDPLRKEDITTSILEAEIDEATEILEEEDGPRIDEIFHAKSRRSRESESLSDDEVDERSLSQRRRAFK